MPLWSRVRTPLGSSLVMSRFVELEKDAECSRNPASTSAIILAPILRGRRLPECSLRLLIAEETGKATRIIGFLIYARYLGWSKLSNESGDRCSGKGSGSRCAVDFHPVFRGSIVEDCEGATVECAARHRGGAAEIVVDRSPIVEIKREDLFRVYLSITVRGLNLGMVTVFCQHVLCPVRGRALRAMRPG